MNIKSNSLFMQTLFSLSIPIIFILIFYYACSEEDSSSNIQDTNIKDIKVSDILTEADNEIQDIPSDKQDIIDITTDTTNDTTDISTFDTDDITSEDIPTDIADTLSDAEEITDILNDIGNSDSGPVDITEDTANSDTLDISDVIESDTGSTDTGLQILQPIINEIMISPNFSDSELGQYVEIYNPNDSSIDIDGYKLRTDKKEFTILHSSCETVIQPFKYIVVGATKDPTKNSYSKVSCEWQESFSLTDALYLELVRPDNVSIEKILFNNLTIKKGSSLEKNKNGFSPSPSLITFLDDTGLYKGDRGSPNKPNWELQLREEITDSVSVDDRIEKENEILRYPLNLTSGDIVAFYADVDRINGNLKLFGSLLDANGDFISPYNYISDITYDFFIYHIANYTGRYYFQIQSDFFYPFEPANIEVTYFRADGLKTNKNLIEIQIGEKYQIESFATFSQNQDLLDIKLNNDMPVYESNDPTIAEVSSDGIITGKNVGSTTVYVTYFYSDNTFITDNIVVNVYSQPSNDTCQEAIDATGGINTYASTIGARDDYNPEECIFSRFSGPDIVYYVDAEPNATYEITVTPYASFDPMIYILDDCNNQKCLYGTVLNGAGDPETLTFKNETSSKKRFYIIIDGEIGDEGTFTLSIIRK